MSGSQLYPSGGIKGTEIRAVWAIMLEKVKKRKMAKFQTLSI
jgi:hypothetical protein